MTEKMIRAVDEILARGDRVELIPGPGGSVKVIHIKREIVLKGNCRIGPRHGKAASEKPETA